MSTHSPSKDPDIIASLRALRRAARRARALSIKTGTPFYVWRNGRVVNLNPKGSLRNLRNRRRPSV